MLTKVDKHKRICKKLNELYERKNADYGDSFGKSFKEYGLTMACIRLEDKLNRIKALSKQEAKVSDERIEDTLMDLANYAIMTLVELDQSVNHSTEAPRGEHNKKCVSDHPSCQCLTCAHDNETCCHVDEHLDFMCPMCKCPDYVREE